MYQLLSADALVLNQPVPVNIWDPKGVLLLRKGETITSEKHRDHILLRSPGVLASEWQAVRYGYTTLLDRLVRNNESLGEIAKVSALTAESGAQAKAQQLLLTDAWADLHAELSSLLRQGAQAIHFLDRLMRVQDAGTQLWQHQPDNSLLVLFQYLFDTHQSYSTTHALLCAGLCQLVGAAAGLEPEAQQRLRLAALTMNLGMTRVHDELARQATPVTNAQRLLIREHPLRSAAALRALGVTDGAWLRLVEQHHERSEGTGYPAGLRVQGAEHRLLELADTYVACISPREGRGSLPTQELARQLYLGAGPTPDRWGALFVKCMGFFPPGSYVRLVNGESGIVVRRGAKANGPRVMSLIGRQGLPLGEPVLRDTSEAAWAVQASLPPGEVKVVVNVARLIARC
ncbi:MAG: HD domain-containing phosphohydrolase [Hydrogenophaga sp.]|nr:HD domain-containing phosphohydrolase [Hydrogenophaga sp.]